jgi:SOS regulatory protein LexA
MTRKRILTREAVLDAINNWIVEHGLPPTIDELRRVLKVGSDRTVLRYLSHLEAAGEIERWSGARGMRTLKKTANGFRTRAVPLVGLVPAGSLMIAEENREGWVQLPTDWLTPPSAKHFLLRVKGDSMNKARVKDERIEDGDLVVVEQRPSASPNEVVVALVDGQATIKRLIKGPSYWILKPESTNPLHSPIILTEDFRVQGVVTRVVKKGSYLLHDENQEP